GFDRDHVLTVTLDERQAGLKNDAAIAFYRNLRTRLAALPGVAAIGLSDLALVGDGRSGTMISAQGGEPRGSRVLKAGGGFFAAMQIPRNARPGPHVDFHVHRCRHTFAMPWLEAGGHLAVTSLAKLITAR